jgi:DHA3 family macrolide efflux protein-like MFS transporter
MTPPIRLSSSAARPANRRGCGVFGLLIAILTARADSRKVAAVTVKNCSVGSTLFTTATFLLSALAVRIAISKPKTPHPRRFAGRAALLDSLIGGVRTARRRPVLLYGLFISLIGNAVWAVGVLLGMILYLRQTSADPLTDYSLMMTGYGIGNLASSLVLANTRKVYPATWLAISKVIFGIGVFLLPLEHGRIWLMAAAAFAATNGPFENLSLLNLIQTGVPARRVGQLYRLQMCATYLGFLLAYLAAPSLFGWFGLRPVIMTAGLLTVVCGLLGFMLFGWPRRQAKGDPSIQTT